MRSIALTTLLALATGAATAASAQNVDAPLHSGDAAVTYQWTGTNTQPGGCGCFGLNGGGISASVAVRPSMAAVAEVTVGHAGNGPLTGNSLTLVTYTAGLRYRIPQDRWKGLHRIEPFAELLAGAAHAGGGIAGAGDGNSAFAGRVGGGLDLPLKGALALRLVQVDYLATTFANSTNNHQNNLLIGAGVTFRWTR